MLVYCHVTPGSICANHCSEHSWSYSPRFPNLKVTQLQIGLIIWFIQSEAGLFSDLAKPGKGRLLVTSIFSLSKKVFKSLSHFPNKALFLCAFNTSLLKTLWGKEKLLITSNFSFFHNVFYPPGYLSIVFIKFSSANPFSLEVSKVCGLGKG